MCYVIIAVLEKEHWLHCVVWRKEIVNYLMYNGRPFCFCAWLWHPWCSHKKTCHVWLTTCTLLNCLWTGYQLIYLLFCTYLFLGAIVQKIDEKAIKEVFLKVLDNYIKWCRYLRIRLAWNRSLLTTAINLVLSNLCHIVPYLIGFKLFSAA